MTDKKITKEQRKTLDALNLIPSSSVLELVVTPEVLRRAMLDDSNAPLMIEKLRYTYSQPFELVFPEYAAANGEVIGIDTRVPPGADEWEYWTVEQTGFASWIGDDGKVAPNGSAKYKRFKGSMSEMGHIWDVTLFDLERAAMQGLPLASMKQENARRTHEAKTNWTWLFGDSAVGLDGLITHPNIQISQAPAAALAPLGDDRDRLIENKTNDEILADIEDLIELIPKTTIRAKFAAKVAMPYKDIALMKRRRLGAGDGTLSLWDYIQSNYGSPQGEHPAVQFMTLNECDPAFRAHPETGTDDSGVSGRFWLAIPQASLDELAFIRARPYTQRTPQEDGFVLKHPTHSKIGGCKCQIPLAVHRKDFLAD